VPSDPAGERYRLEFDFDASAPAAATVFFGAAEDPRRRCALRAATVGIEGGDGDGRTGRLLASKVAAVYPKGGMGLRFPPPSPEGEEESSDSASDAAAAAAAAATGGGGGEGFEERSSKRRHSLILEGCMIAAETAAALAADSERAMSSQAAAASGSSSSTSSPALPPFAVAVRLEALTPEGEGSPSSGGVDLLRKLVPGAPHSAGTQSQTTFARILPVRRKPPQHQEGGGGGGGGSGGEISQPPVYELRVVKQKIWVAGVSYELQEIYGMGAAASAASAAAAAAASSAAAAPPPSNANDEPGTATTGMATALSDANTAISSSSTAAEEERLCVVCLCEPRDTTVLPCRHM